MLASVGIHNDWTSSLMFYRLSFCLFRLLSHTQRRPFFVSLCAVPFVLCWQHLWCLRFILMVKRIQINEQRKRSRNKKCELMSIYLWSLFQIIWIFCLFFIDSCNTHDWNEVWISSNYRARKALDLARMDWFFFCFIALFVIKFCQEFEEKNR